MRGMAIPNVEVVGGKVVSKPRREWTALEVAELIAMRAPRMSLPRIARALDRSVHSVEGKAAELIGRGLCARPKRASRIADPVTHFWARVDRSGGQHACWPWSARSRSGSGYGLVSYDLGDGARLHGAHRVALSISLGRPIQLGLHVMHSCDNPPCCNPAHLSEGTRSDNMTDASRKGRISRTPKTFGENHPCAKLTAIQVVEARRRAADGISRRSLAAEYGLSKSGMDHLIAGRSWAL